MSLVAVVLLRAVDHPAAVALLLRAVAAAAAAAVDKHEAVQEVLLLLALWLRSPLFGGLFLRLRFTSVFLELYYIIRGVL